MMAEMDESGDGTIDFEEFAVAMHHNYDDSLIEAASKVSPRHGRGGASEGGDSGKGRRAANTDACRTSSRACSIVAGCRVSRPQAWCGTPLNCARLPPVRRASAAWARRCGRAAR